MSQHIYDYHTFNINSKTREIYLTGHTNEDDAEITFRSSSSFIKNLQLLNSFSSSPIVIHLQSIGGNVDDGFAIYDAIKNSKSPTIIVGYGLVASMASLVFQAPNCRVLTENSCVLIHDVLYGTDVKDITSISSDLEFFKKQKEKMLSLMNFKSNKNLEKLLMEKREFYLTPKESIEYGLCDGILGQDNYNNLDLIRKKYDKRRIQ